MSNANSSTGLARQSCKPCATGDKPLNDARIAAFLTQIPGWKHAGGEITKTFRFKNYHESIAFVNATAWVSHREDHHPDLEVGYNKVRMRYSTHAVGGLSKNDFICASKIEALMKI